MVAKVRTYSAPSHTIYTPKPSTEGEQIYTLQVRLAAAQAKIRVLLDLQAKALKRINELEGSDGLSR